VEEVAPRLGDVLRGEPADLGDLAGPGQMRCATDDEATEERDVEAAEQPVHADEVVDLHADSGFLECLSHDRFERARRPRPLRPES